MIPLQLPPNKYELQHCPNTGGMNPDEDLGGSQGSLHLGRGPAKGLSFALDPSAQRPLSEPHLSVITSTWAECRVDRTLGSPPGSGGLKPLSLVQGNPTYCGATKFMHHNY